MIAEELGWSARQTEREGFSYLSLALLRVVRSYTG